MIDPAVKATLEQIAALAKTLPGGSCLTLSLGVVPAAGIAQLGGCSDTSVYDPDPWRAAEGPYAIDGLCLRIDGLEVRAFARDRPATPEEVAGLASARSSTPRRSYTRDQVGALDRHQARATSNEVTEGEPWTKPATE